MLFTNLQLSCHIKKISHHISHSLCDVEGDVHYKILQRSDILWLKLNIQQYLVYTYAYTQYNIPAPTAKTGQNYRYMACQL